MSLIETLAGMIILIPIGLASVDLYAMVMGNQLNVRIVEDAARAASNQLQPNDAENVAKQAVSGIQFHDPITSITLSEFKFDLTIGQVSAGTTLTMNLPVPVAGWSTITLHSTAVEPIVAIPGPQ